MNSFTLTAVGNLARDPEFAAKGDTSYARFCLVGNDYAGKDEHGNAREAVTSLWFTAFESIGEVIAKNARKGDQLIIQAQVRANNWTGGGRSGARSKPGRADPSVCLVANDGLHGRC